MLSTIRLTNFRAFQDFELGGLSRVNLFVGGNSVGKTSLLTAMVALVGRWPQALFLPILGEYPELSRPHLPWRALFRQGPGTGGVRLTGMWDGEPRRLHIDLDLPGAGAPATRAWAAALSADGGALRVADGVIESTWPAPSASVNLWKRVGFSTQDLDRARELALEGRLGSLLPALQSIEPRLTALEFVGDGLVVAFEGSSRRVPIATLGDGAQAIINVLLIVAGSAQHEPPLRLVALDEIDSGLHRSALPDLWAFIARAPDSVQFAITTHRDESVIAAAQAFEELGRPNDLRVIRLERTPDGGHEAVAYTATEALSSMAAGWDVRG